MKKSKVEKKEINRFDVPAFPKEKLICFLCGNKEKAKNLVRRRDDNLACFDCFEKFGHE